MRLRLRRTSTLSFRTTDSERTTSIGRPRQHELTDVINDAVSIIVHDGIENLTLRGLAERAKVPNGTIYHAFGSKAGLVATAYLHHAEPFLSLQRDQVQQAYEAHRTDVAAPVIAAAQALSVYAQNEANGAILLMTLSMEDIAATDITDTLRARLRPLADQLTALLIRLAESVLGASGRLEVETIRACVIELPTGLLLSQRHISNPAAITRVEAATRGILTAALAQATGDRTIT